MQATYHAARSPENAPAVDDGNIACVATILRNAACGFSAPLPSMTTLAQAR
jgi:hypothetical protein